LIRRVEVNLGNRSYPILIGENLLAALGTEVRARIHGERVLVISNPTVRGLYGKRAEESLAGAGLTVVWGEMPDGEEYKTLETVSRLYDLAVEAELDRGCAVVGLGGGVVGDTAGFVAATYMRGVPFVQVPTTLLAQVDSSVGGKVGVNHPKGKNMIGAFYQPRLVLADIGTLASLPSGEIRAGLAEVIKYGVIWDAPFFNWLEENVERLLELDPDAITYAVAQACGIKADVVAADETEQGRRQILNYGHTFGHAVEALTGYRRFRHGEAVAIGMATAARMAERMGILGSGDRQRIEALIVRTGLPVEMPRDFTAEQYLEAMAHDKKARSGVLTFVLPSAIGKVQLQALSPSQLLSLRLIR